MITELAGYTLTRTIPDSVLLKVATGAYKVFGGVVRDPSNGQIVAHLVNTNLSKVLSVPLSPVAEALSGINTFQLHKIGQNVEKLLETTQLIAATSGLTLAVSVASFAFLNQKLNKIDSKLSKIASDVKFIKEFLDQQERSRLITALRTLKELPQISDSTTKSQMLVNSRQILGETHEKYKSLMNSQLSVNEFDAIEEYFVISSLGHVLCSAELGLIDEARADFLDAHAIWSNSSKQFINEHVLTNKPERLLGRKYVETITTHEIVEFMDYVSDDKLGVQQIDELRKKTGNFEFNIFNASAEDQPNIQVGRKLIERSLVLQGYEDQYAYLANSKQKPSLLNQFFNCIDSKNTIGGHLIFLADQFAKPL